MAARLVSLSALVAVVFAVVPAHLDAQGMPSSLAQFVQQTIGLSPRPDARVSVVDRGDPELAPRLDP